MPRISCWPGKCYGIISFENLNESFIHKICESNMTLQSPSAWEFCVATPNWGCKTSVRQITSLSAINTHILQQTVKSTTLSHQLLKSRVSFLAQETRIISKTNEISPRWQSPAWAKCQASPQLHWVCQSVQPKPQDLCALHHVRLCSDIQAV